jgi:HSP20 family protein
MPTVIRKSLSTLPGSRRETPRSLSWQVLPNIWSPPIDQYELEEAFIVRMEIAGMHEDDFEVFLENTTLLISGSRLDPPERRAYQQMEIRFGKFSSSVTLSGPVNIDLAHTKYKDGFLVIVLPKENQNKVE